MSFVISDVCIIYLSLSLDDTYDEGPIKETGPYGAQAFIIHCSVSTSSGHQLKQNPATGSNGSFI